MTVKPVLPGSTVGVLGSGQLGRMFAIAARRMGYRVHTFSPDSDTPTGQVSDLEVDASYDDLSAVAKFARNVQVITFEFENVPAAAVEAASRFTLVRPHGSVLEVTQHRVHEKSFVQSIGIPVTRFAAVSSREDLDRAVAEIGMPSVLKTAKFGYDGKGQFKIERAGQLDEAWEAVKHHEAILEGFVDFEREISVVAARGADGAFAHYGVIENSHVHSILDVSVSPAAVSEKVARDAIDAAHHILEKLGVVGVMCVEFFVTRDGSILVNELAPRPHNSGHLTFDACITSQFEQQLRAVCGLSLGSTEYVRAAAMANLMGELWASGEPNWAAAAKFPNVKLHLYGKLDARRGRKMGHLTALAATAEEARETVLAARSALTNHG